MSKSLNNNNCLDNIISASCKYHAWIALSPNVPAIASWGKVIKIEQCTAYDHIWDITKAGFEPGHITEMLKAAVINIFLMAMI